MQLIHDADPDGLEARLEAQLSACLDKGGERPIAVGLSGGSDSHALLRLACMWAAKHGRRILALTVDHRLNPKSADWTRQAAAMARDAGADWQGLAWENASGGTAIQERARMARHALLAEAARQAGASILMLGHTADDVAENELMRAQGTSVGRLRPMSPSPVWPQGRGVTLFRPLLNERRQVLRDWLTAQGQDWIDDPANQDSRYARVRARQQIAGKIAPPTLQKSVVFADPGERADAGVFHFDRGELAASAHGVSVALLCASGHDVPPRSDRLGTLMAALGDGEDRTMILSGTRIEMTGGRVLMFREAGEQKRARLGATVLENGHSMVWDNRFEVTAREDGWEILAGAGNLSKLSDDDRKSLSAMPPAARLSWPVLHKPLTDHYVLANDRVELRGLCGRRYRATALCLADETPQEGALFDLWHGETGSTALFSR
ncbi:tRNA lysidine(34) synthetase TilS [uncultured Brevundimonas sp.]|uniref:tRNA lysidine(34) synthetase TilS n=1 Tax=uncultured Brevundimonas sp. TaxID=213418 RepID=UPI00261C7D77|nr:tRNA lysidine(34) synthetase TilS [uncultured Brevundimonas sp.]